MAYRSIWTTLLLLSTAANAATTTASAPSTISSEVLNFVPTCAQQCFQSFIQRNFDSALCGDSPSLACLCTHTGSSGYTVGEGGLSCIGAEANFGGCQRSDASNVTLNTAYNMCVGFANAAAETHSTIVATLVLPPSGTTGPLVVPTATSTTTPTSTAFSMTITPSASATSTASASQQSGSQTTTNQRPQLNGAQIAGITLGCAAVLLLGILLVMLARWVRNRRFGGDPESGFSKMPKSRDSWSFGGKKSNNNSPHMLQISNPIPKEPVEMDFARPGDNTMMPMGYPESVGLAVSGGPVPVPVPGQTATATAVGLPGGGPPTMIVTPPSRSQTMETEQQGNSPPRPALTLAIPNPSQSIEPPLQTGRTLGGRDSIVTEFAEDGDDYEIRSGAPNGGGIWRPPPTDPQSATALYFADKGGNWVLRNSSVAQKPVEKKQQKQKPVVVEELPSPESQTKAERAASEYGGYMTDASSVRVAPLRVPGKQTAQQQAKLGSPIIFRDEQLRRTRDRDDRASSMYSTVSGPLSIAPGPDNPLRTPDPTPPSSQKRQEKQKQPPPPDTYFAMLREKREREREREDRGYAGGGGVGVAGPSQVKRSSRRKSRRASRQQQSRRSKRWSQDSATTIESAGGVGAGDAGDETPFEEDDCEDEDIIEDEPQEDLSPVFESPRTPPKPGQFKQPLSPTGGGNGGKSPVEYPRIHAQQNNNKMAYGLPSNPSPRYRPENALHLQPAPGMNSPPLAGGPVKKTRTTTTTGTQQAGQVGPRRLSSAPALNPNPNPMRNPGQIKTGSPEFRQQPPPLNTAVSAPQLQQQGQGQGVQQQRYWEQQPSTAQQQAKRTSQRQSQRHLEQQYWNEPAHHEQRERYSRQQLSPTPEQQHHQRRLSQQIQQRQDAQAQMQLQQHHRRTSQQQQQAQHIANQTAGQSSLLAKRVGTDRAAALSLAGKQVPLKKNKTGWSREQMQQQQQQGGGGPGLLVDGEKIPVPITPGWVPTLTPTRRGEDLFLNVQ
ncbi:hypothetical protein QBC46DRAFT_424915 [Diplogelasinospora grovesii]|uniref:Extracellular membrane protein CFEM domain-containing protein n=1 Tax=Diplogelasinospora grovesii TaxID=303347 RepID=A0AAN6NIY8_9PEZI|nr:hypothetical protein QBC46DRAFT_424915 [Diplogelasinospora grovesii]